MTTLHWALLAIAAVLLLALWVYGKWQERRELARLDLRLRGGVSDPLAPAATRTARIEPRLEPRADGRVEPRLDALDRTADASTTAPLAMDAGAADPVSAAGAAPEREASAYALPDGWAEDPLLDFVIELRCTHAIDGVAAIEARAQLERLQLPLPSHLAVWDAKSQHWTAPDRFGFYSDLLVAVQMAHRKGVLGEIDAARFIAATQQIALAVDADFDSPDAGRLVAQAAALDQLCARHDVQITLTLEALNGVWTADVVQAVAGPLGFAGAAAGRWELREADGSLQLILAAPSMPTQRLALTIDVPLVRPETSPLARQYTVAEQLAAGLSARVVDDNGRAVQREAHFAVAAQLASLYEQMQAVGVAAGALRARRLYAV